MTVTSVEWKATERWFFGELQPVEPLVAGDRLVLTYVGDWGLKADTEVLLAVATVTLDESSDGIIVAAVGPNTAVASSAAMDSHALAEDAETWQSVQRVLGVAGSTRNVDLGSASDAAAQARLMTELVEDGRRFLDAENRLGDAVGSVELRPDGLLADILGSDSEPVLPSTAQDDDLLGFDLDLMLDQQPNDRQLPVSYPDLDELSSGLGQPVEHLQAVVFDETSQYTFFALRFDGIGVLGPWSSDPSLSYARLRGIGPTAGKGTVLAWTSGDPQPDSSIELGAFIIPEGWNPSSDTLALGIEVDGEVAVTLVDNVALVKQIDEMLADQQRGG